MNRKRFGTFELDLETGELRRSGIKLRLQEKPFQLLALLLERPGEIVTRDAVRDRLWPADTFVDFEHGLNTAVRKLRQVLGDSADTPRFIETVPRRGYRFIAPVASPADAAAPAQPVPPEASPSPPPRSTSPAGNRWLVISLAAAVVLVAGWVASRNLRPGGNPPAEATAPTSMHLAVLPFKDLTSGESDKFPGIGIADAVITHLANIRTIRVRPTAAVLKYNSDGTDPVRAGRELGVAHVLVGTLQKAEGRYRIAVQLIRTSDGAPFWGRSYDVAAADLFTIEDQVSIQVAEALRVELTAADRVNRRVPRTPAAYEPYVLARGLVGKYTEAHMRDAIDSFERALTIDPDYALARAGLATAQAWFSVRYAYEKDALLWGRRAEEQAHRALALDPGLAEAHLAIASAAGTLHGRFNWPRLLDEVDQALTIDPSLDLAFAMRARALYHFGLFDDAAAAAARALAINPDNPAAPFEAERLLAASALFGGRFSEARTRAETLVKKSNAPAVRMYLGMALFYLGERQQAAELLASVKRGSQPDVRSQAVLASVLAANGQSAEAQSTIDRIIGGAYMDHHVAYSLGAAFAQLRRRAEAVKWLRAAIDDGFPCYPWFASDPLLDPIRQDEDYRVLSSGLQKTFDATRVRYSTRAR